MIKTRAMASLMGGEQFHYAQEPLTFSVREIRMTLEPGEVREGAFTVYGPEGMSVNGFVSSTRLAMQCLSDTFAGSQDVIGYRFDAAAFGDGDILEGEFRIVSNQGEYAIPFSVTVCAPRLMSEAGPVENLLQFTNLAKSNWKEAVSLFYSPEFLSVFSEQEREEEALYRGLSAVQGNEQNVEEFLIAAGLKKAAEFLPEQKQIRLEWNRKTQEMVEYRIALIRNGWGYTRLTAETDGAFLQLLQPVISQEDFLAGAAQSGEAGFYSDTCEVKFCIDPERLHEGCNFGALTFHAPFGTFTVPVEVVCRTSPLPVSMRTKERSQLILRMMRYYEDFRSKKMKSREWLSQTGVVIERLRAVDPASVYPGLYQAHLLVTAGKNAEAMRELQRMALRDRARAEGQETQSSVAIRAAAEAFRLRESGWEGTHDAGIPGAESDPDNPADGSMASRAETMDRWLRKLLEENPVAYCYAQYITALCAPENSGAAARAVLAIEEQHKREPSNWRIAWLLLYLSDHYRKRPSVKWNMLREQFAYGCRSPLLYLEAYGLISINPAIAGRLEEFELQTLLYAAKKGMLTPAVMTQVNMLARSQRVFSGKLLRILTAGYALEELREETLESICALLIKGNVSDGRYFHWYQEGVEAQLRVTRLYEYYMLSLPEDFEGELPQSVLLYFCYQSTLPYDKNAYLYRYMHEHREQYGELYHYYEPEILRFTMLALDKGRTGRDLQYLYGTFLDERTVNAQNAAAAARAVFGCVIRTADFRAAQLILRYEKSSCEEVYPVENGICYLPVYGEEAAFFFADEAGNRYAESIPYTCEKMSRREELLRLLARFDTGIFGLDLYLSGLPGADYAVSAGNCARYLGLAESEKVSPAYRQILRLRLLHYYNDNDCIREMDAYLGRLTPANLRAPERGEIVRFLTLRGIYDKAMEWIRRYGTYGVDEGTLFRLCSRFLSREEPVEDEVLAGIVYQTFLLGKYDESLLSYLEYYFNGLTREMNEIRQAMRSFGMETSFLAGRMLRQMLYSGIVLPQQGEIAQEYRAGGADPELLSAVLAQSSHAYFAG
ncbi:MAG: DUF5717 family protein, partial [Eubacteriales bacterium]|nr:DUF5717 family protein [Eubacteriales bacterium]